MTNQFSRRIDRPMAMRLTLALFIAAFSLANGTQALVRSQEPDKAKDDEVRKAELPKSPAHKADYAHEYYHSFQKDREISPEFHWHGVEPESSVEFEPEGLRISLPAGFAGKRPGTGMGLNTPVTGDFEITLRYEILKEPDVADAKEPTGLFVWVDLNKPKLNRGFVSRVTREGKLFITWHHLTPEPPAKQVSALRPFPAKDKSGQLRLVRTASVLYYYVAEDAGEDFRLLQKHPFGAEDLQAVRWGGQTGGPNAALEGRFIDLRIRADGLPELANVVKLNPTAPPPSQEAGSTSKTNSGAGWLALGLGVGLAMLAILALGLVLVLRRRQPASTILPESKDDAPPTQASLSFPCSKCGKRIKVRSAIAGKKVKCPQCGQATLVPGTESVDDNRHAGPQPSA